LFTISIDQFEGPLDLMLYLIKDKKLDLFDLDILVLIEQYQLYLEQMHEQRFEIATEYISEFAGLIEYKSKKLIPTIKAEFEEELPEEPVDIVARLLAYEQAKKASEYLKTQYEQRMQLLSKTPTTFTGQYDTIKEQTPQDLYKAFEKVMARLRLMNPYEMKTTNRDLSISDRINELRAIISHREHVFSLTDLLNESEDIHTLIVTFLAILDMIRLRELDFTTTEDVVYLQRRAYG
jgi:segregation and condensation protein A